MGNSPTPAPQVGPGYARSWCQSAVTLLFAPLHQMVGVAASSWLSKRPVLPGLANSSEYSARCSPRSLEATPTARCVFDVDRI